MPDLLEGLNRQQIEQYAALLDPDEVLREADKADTPIDSDTIRQYASALDPDEVLNKASAADQEARKRLARFDKDAEKLVYAAQNSEPVLAIKTLRRFDKGEWPDLMKAAEAMYQQSKGTHPGQKPSALVRGEQAFVYGLKDYIQDPIKELILGTTGLATRDELDALENVQLSTRDQYYSEDDSWLTREAIKAAGIAGPMMAMASTGQSFAGGAKALGAGRLGASVATGAGVTAAGFAGETKQFRREMLNLGVNKKTAGKLAPVVGTVIAAVESLVDPFNFGRPELRAGFKAALKTVAMRALVNFPGEVTEEWLQRFVGDVGLDVATWLDTNAPDTQFANEFKRELEVAKESIVPLAIAMGGPAAMEIPVQMEAAAEYESELQEVLGKGFVSEEDGRKYNLTEEEMKNRKTRKAALERQLKELQGVQNAETTDGVTSEGPALEDTQTAPIPQTGVEQGASGLESPAGETESGIPKPSSDVSEPEGPAGVAQRFRVRGTNTEGTVANRLPSKGGWKILLVQEDGTKAWHYESDLEPVEEVPTAEAPAPAPPTQIQAEETPVDEEGYYEVDDDRIAEVVSALEQEAAQDGDAGAKARYLLAYLTNEDVDEDVWGRTFAAAEEYLAGKPAPDAGKPVEEPSAEEVQSEEPFTRTFADAHKMTLREFLKGAKPPAKQSDLGLFSNEVLTAAGRDKTKPGLSVSEGEFGTLITYRDPQGKPVASATIEPSVKYPGEFSVAGFATDKSRGVLAARAAVAVGKELLKRNATRARQTISRDAAKLLHHAAVSLALERGEPVSNEVLADYPNLKKRGVGRKKTEEAPKGGVLAPEAELFNRIRSLDPAADQGVAVSIRELRKATEDILDKKSFDELLIRLTKQGVLDLQMTDNFMDMSDAEREQLLVDKNGDHFIGVSIRPGAAPAAPQATEDLILGEETPDPQSPDSIPILSDDPDSGGIPVYRGLRSGKYKTRTGGYTFWTPESEYAQGYADESGKVVEAYLTDTRGILDLTEMVEDGGWIHGKQIDEAVPGLADALGIDAETEIELERIWDYAGEDLSDAADKLRQAGYEGMRWLENNGNEAYMLLSPPKGEETPEPLPTQEGAAQEPKRGIGRKETYTERKRRVDEARKRGDMTMREVDEGTEAYRGKGGISAETRGSGFQAAFRDNETGEVAIPMTDLGGGRTSPAGVHVFDGLPDSFVTERDDYGDPIAVKGSVEAGFVKDGEFYTRDEAAAAVSEAAQEPETAPEPKRGVGRKEKGEAVSEAPAQSETTPDVDPLIDLTRRILANESGMSTQPLIDVIKKMEKGEPLTDIEIGSLLQIDKVGRLGHPHIGRLAQALGFDRNAKGKRVLQAARGEVDLDDMSYVELKALAKDMGAATKEVRKKVDARGFIENKQAEIAKRYSIDQPVPEPPAQQGVSGEASKPSDRPDVEPKAGSVSGAMLQPIQMPELFQLAKDLMEGKIPSVKKSGNAAGRFKGQEGIGPLAILIDPSTAADENALAQTLAHEIGHLIDFLPGNTLKRGNLLGRLQSLRDFMKSTMPALDKKEQAKLRREARKNAGGKKASKAAVDAEYQKLLKSRGFLANSTIRDELIRLTKWWSGDYAGGKESYVQYRQSSRELYAEALSVFLNSPGDLETRAPTFYKALLANLNTKPEVLDAYSTLQQMLNGTGQDLAESRTKTIRDMFGRAEDHINYLRAAEEQRKKTTWAGVVDFLGSYFLNSAQPVLTKIGRKPIRSSESPEAEAARFALDELFTIDSPNHTFLRHVDEQVYQPLIQLMQEQGLDRKAAEAEANFTLGEYLYHWRVANERDAIANPAGFTATPSNAQLDAIRERIGDAAYAKLQEYAQNFHDLVYAIAEEATNEGVYNRETFDEVITPNKDNYAAFRVTHHIDDPDIIATGVIQQVGTFSDIQNPFHATVLKVVRLNRLIELNRAKNRVRKLLESSFPDDISPVEMVFNGEGRPRIPRKRPGKGKDHLVELVDGSPVYFEVPSEIAKSFSMHDIGGLGRLAAMLNSGTYKVFHPLFVTYNPGFVLANPFRDLRRTWVNLGATDNISLRRLLYEWARALPTAVRRQQGLEDDVIKEMLDNHALDIPYTSVAAEDIEAQVDELFQKYGLREKPKRPMEKLPVIGRVLELIEHAGAVTETASKVAGWRLLEQKGIPVQERAYRVRKYVGTPDYKQRGLATALTNSAFMYSRVRWNGLQADVSLATNPETAAGWWWRQVLNVVLPTSLSKAAAYGALGLALRAMFGVGDDDDDDTTVGKVASWTDETGKRVAKYFLTDYDVIPLGVNKDGKAVFITIPRDDLGKFIARTWWHATDLAQLAAGQRLREGEQARDVAGNEFTDIKEQLIPSASPPIEITNKWLQYGVGVNPIDSFYNQQIIPAKEWEAGGWHADSKMIAWTLDEFGAPGALIHYPLSPFLGESFETGTSGGVEAVMKTVGAMTGLKRLVRVSNSGLTSDQWALLENADQDDTAFRLGLPESAQTASSRRYFLTRREALGDKLSKEEQDELHALNLFYGAAYLPLRKMIQEAEEAELDSTQYRDDMEQAADDPMSLLTNPPDSIRSIVDGYMQRVTNTAVKPPPERENYKSDAVFEEALALYNEAKPHLQSRLKNLVPSHDEAQQLLLEYYFMEYGRPTPSYGERAHALAKLYGTTFPEWKGPDGNRSQAWESALKAAREKAKLKKVLE
jgi:hypothetical protein